MHIATMEGYMDLRALQYLLAVADEGSISNAAKSLHMTQPTLSRQLTALEDELGCKLFTRTYKGMEPNENGTKLLRYAQSMLELEQKAKDELRQGEESVTGSVYIGAGETTNMRFVAQAMQEVSKDHPEVDFELFSGSTVDLFDGFMRGAYDFLIECEVKAHVDMNSAMLPIEDVWGVYTRRNSRIGSLKRARPEDLVGEPLLMARQASDLGKLERWAGEIAEEYDVRVTYGLPLNAALIARVGFGSLLTYENLNEVGQETEMVFVPLFPKLTSKQGIVWRKTELSKQAQVFLESFTAICSAAISNTSMPGKAS